MNYYVETNFFDHDGLVTSGGKGRDDYFEMLKRCGLECIRIPALKRKKEVSAADRIRLEAELTKAWRKALSRLGRGDALFIHNPPSEKFMSFTSVINEVRKRGCRIVTIVFDLETYLKPYYGRAGGFRYSMSLKTERALLIMSDFVMVHNEMMKETVVSMGVDHDRIVCVGVMDYLKEEAPDRESIISRTGKDLPLVFCGNLIPEKAGFLESVPADVEISLYGPGYSGKGSDNIFYKGIVPSLEIMDVLSGSFGLVWDGDSSRLGSGAGGEYLRINNPHKMALYLASGLPVIVWEESAMTGFVRDENCGFAVNSLDEIRSFTDNLTDEEYSSMRENAIRVGSEMRKGVHLEAAVMRMLDHLKKTDDRRAMIIFTREPVPGSTKTRLMPYMTGEQCADLHECFIRDIYEEMKKANADLIVAYTGEKPVRLRKIFGESIPFIEQRGADIGEKMENAIADVLGMGYDKVILTGTDIPEMEHETLDEALDMLDDADVVLCPTEDGGYFLIGMKEVRTEAFNVSLYGVSSVFDETVQSLEQAGLSVAVGDMYSDIDTPEDLAEYRRRMRHDRDMQKTYTGRFAAANASVSVIIPVYNEIKTIDPIMEQLGLSRNKAEIIFVDGGSTDGTAEHIGKTFRVISSKKGRGVQMNTGAEASHGDILFFLHCDSILPAAFLSQIRRVMAHSDWGCFGVKFPSKNFFMYTNRIISNHRAMVRGIPFGDQGIFIDRSLFMDMGMFPEAQVMEDYEFSLMMKKNGFRPGMTQDRVTTSARRYGQGTRSILRTELGMWNLRRLYRKGTNADELIKRYKDIR